jgi:hypothetical protein
MFNRGLRPGDDASVATALTKLEQEKFGLDHNGVDDVDRLRQGLDPSTGQKLAEGASCVDVPLFGCLARVARSASPVSRESLLALVAALVLLGRRRRRSVF